MDNLLPLLVLVLFGGMGLIAIFTIVNLLVPLPVERARTILETSLPRSILVGLVNSVFAGAVTFLLLLPTRIGGWAAGVSVIVAGLVVVTVIALLLLGLVALTQLLGMRIGGSVSPVVSHVRGGALLLLACLTPFLGWFVITPLILWAGLGAGIQTLVRKKETPAA